MAMVSSLPLSSAAIFFITGIFLTVGLFYRLFRICAGRHQHENSYKVLTIPAVDIILFLTLGLFIEHLFFGIRVSENLTHFGNGVKFTTQEVSTLHNNLDILIASNIAMMWLTKLSLYVLFFECFSYFPQSLRPVVIGAPVVHFITFLVAWLLQIFHVGSQAGNLTFTITTDLVLISLSVLLLLHPTVRGSATPRQAKIAWILVTIGVFSLVSGIVRFAATRRPAGHTDNTLDTALDCRNMLWMAIETCTAVVCCHTPAFRRLLAPEKKHANHHDESEEKDIQLAVSPRTGRPRSEEAWV